MNVSIRDITAWCAWCGGKDFVQLSAEQLRLASELKCGACGARYTYLQLLDQIGEEAIRRANKAIDDLKRHPRR
jgi:transcription elongation factor Elf1